MSVESLGVHFVSAKRLNTFFFQNKVPVQGHHSKKNIDQGHPFKRSRRQSRLAFLLFHLSEKKGFAFHAMQTVQTKCQASDSLKNNIKIKCRLLQF